MPTNRCGSMGGPRVRSAADAIPLKAWLIPRRVLFLANCLCLACVALVAYGAYSWAVRSTFFDLRRVEVRGRLKHIDADSLAEPVRRIKGNFVNLDLVALQRDLELVPWVRSVSIRRLWPDRLVLELEERTALARWNGRALVDSAGEIFAGKYAGSLTSFVGPPGSARQMSEQYAEFKEVLHSAGLAPLELLLSQRRSWTLRLNNGLTLQLGRDEPARRLARFVSAYAVLGEYGAPGANVDLRYNNGFALRMAERPGAASSQK